MDKQSYLNQVKQAAFVDELGQSETGVRVAESMGFQKEAQDNVIPAARVVARPTNARDRAQAAFNRSPISRAAPAAAAPAAAAARPAAARPAAAPAAAAPIRRPAAG